MKQVLAACAVVVVVGCSRVPEPPGTALQSKLERVTSAPSDAVLSATVEGNTTAGLALYRKLVEGDDNFFFSPHSIISVLGLAYGGAAGDSRSELAALLHAPEAADFHRSMNHLDRALRSRGANSQGAGGEPFALHSLNQLFADTQHPVQAGYLDLLQQEYGLGVRQLDIAGAPTDATRKINEWVSLATKQKIPTLLGPADVTERTKLVLVNAMYFSSAWASNFDVASTAELPFHGLAGTRSLPMMRSTNLSAKELETDELQAVQVTYSGGELSMLILMPKGDYRAWEASLTTATLQDARAALQAELLDLSLPKFELRSRRDLRPTLEALGVTTSFDPERADFSAMSTDPTFLAFLTHEAWVDVSESGTRAAAATAGGFASPPSVPPQPKRVIIDRPFFFVIQDDATKAVLFAGRYVKPN